MWSYEVGTFCRALTSGHSLSFKIVVLAIAGEELEEQSRHGIHLTDVALEIIITSRIDTNMFAAHRKKYPVSAVANDRKHTIQKYTSAETIILQMSQTCSSTAS